MNNLLDEKGSILLKEEERQPVECWTRVMGYFRPTAEFNIGKKQEHKDRKFFKENPKKEF